MLVSFQDLCNLDKNWDQNVMQNDENNVSLKY